MVYNESEDIILCNARYYIMKNVEKLVKPFSRIRNIGLFCRNTCNVIDNQIVANVIMP